MATVTAAPATQPAELLLHFGVTMDDLNKDEEQQNGAKRPRLPAVFEAVKAGRFDELSLTSEIVAQALDEPGAGRRGRSGAGVVAAPEAERVLGEGVGEPGRPRTRGVSMCGEVHEVCVVCVGAENIDLLVASRASSRAYPASRDARGVKAVP